MDENKNWKQLLWLYINCISIYRKFGGEFFSLEAKKNRKKRKRARNKTFKNMDECVCGSYFFLTLLYTMCISDNMVINGYAFAFASVLCECIRYLYT